MFERVSRLVKTTGRTVLPYPLHVFFRRPAGNDEEAARIRKDRVRFDIGPELFLEVYWKVLGTGKGPALVVNARGHEILRFDCFGRGKGHAHIKVMEWRPGTKEYHMLYEQDVSAQIERAIFEVGENLEWYLQRHPLPGIRNLRADAVQLADSLPRMRELLHSYKAKVDNERK